MLKWTDKDNCSLVHLIQRETVDKFVDGSRTSTTYKYQRVIFRAIKSHANDGPVFTGESIYTAAPQGFIQDFWLGRGNLLMHQQSAEM